MTAPCWKPEPREKRKPKGLARKTPLRAKSTLRPSKIERLRAWLTGSSLPKKSAHRDRDWADQYGSKERVEWINAMPCAVCGCTGWTQNAHVVPRSRGGKARDIAPLCGDRFGVAGCHGQLDRYEIEDERDRLVRVARALDREWDARGAA